MDFRGALRERSRKIIVLSVAGVVLGAALALEGGILPSYAGSKANVACAIGPNTEHGQAYVCGTSNGTSIYASGAGNTANLGVVVDQMNPNAGNWVICKRGEYVWTQGDNNGAWGWMVASAMSKSGSNVPACTTQGVVGSQGLAQSTPSAKAENKCTQGAAVSLTDPYGQGGSLPTWTCGSSAADLYGSSDGNPNTGSVVDHMNAGNNWVICREGSYSWTQGDNNGAWGWMASSALTKNGSVPLCDFKKPKPAAPPAEVAPPAPAAPVATTSSKKAAATAAAIPPAPATAPAKQSLVARNEGSIPSECGEIKKSASSPLPPGTFSYSDNFYPGGGHYAVDLMAADGTKVCSIGNGQVVETSYDSTCGYLIKIQYGDLFAMYCHGKAFKVTVDNPATQKINEGAVVAGQLIMESSNTGSPGGGVAYAPHLHLEISTSTNFNMSSRSDSTRRNPVAYLQERGIDLASMRGW